MNTNIKIAIDGPSGAGKSTVAKKLAKKLNIAYLDTGAMYRAIALKFKRIGFENFSDIEGIKEICENTSIKVSESQIFLDGEDVSGLIRNDEISLLASKISAIKEIRDFLVKIQREIAENQSIILDGRDVGTVILPNADFKFFLTATPEERAKRRYLEFIEKGNSNYEEVLSSILKRDHDDSTRKNSPLKISKSGILVDSTNLSIEETVELMYSDIREKYAL